MCGLVGVITKKPNGFSKEQQDLFANLLFVDLLRGKDSTGMFVVNNEGDVAVAKDTGHSLNFMQTKEYTELQHKAWNRGAAMIGHNRAATRGVVNDANAHPFNVEDTILLVHNGTMRSDHKKHADVEVDSHAIAHLIHSKESIGEALSAFHGAYALIWYNIATCELNMIRNDERPLFWMELEDAWVWSSEKAMLEFAAGRVNVKIKTEPTMLPVDTLQTFKLENKQWIVTDQKVEVKKPVYQSYSYHGGHGNAFGNNGWDGEEYREWDDESRSFRPMGMATGQEWYDYRRERESIERARDKAIANQRGHSVIELLPGRRVIQKQQQSPALERARQIVEAREPPEFSGLEEREREMAIKLNKIITNKHYREVVLGQFPYNTTAHVSPFDYAYVNGRDVTDGFYLYACPFEDEDIICRQFFSSKAVTEERMIQLAGTQYVFEFQIQQRSWHYTEPAMMRSGMVRDDTPGYAIIRSASCKMIATPDQRPSGVSH